jgi:hypothetical protein
LREPESLGSIISRGRVPGPTRKKQKLDLLAMNWGHIAGERMAAHSTPTRLIRGTLTVSADSPAWAAELSITTETLLRKIAGIMGEESVRKVRIQSRGKVRGSDEEASGGGSGEGPGGQPVGGKLADDIEALEDEEMRKALGRLARASSSSKQSDHKEG